LKAKILEEVLPQASRLDGRPVFSCGIDLSQIRTPLKSFSDREAAQLDEPGIATMGAL
jgi:hypothetical protein